jgi:TP901 family phage tail tape measure protein
MSTKIRDEDIRFNVILNGQKAQKELHELEKANRDLNNSQKDLRAQKKLLYQEGKKNTEAYKKITSEIDKNSLSLTENKARMIELKKELGVAGLTMRQLRSRAAQLRAQLYNMVPGSDQYKKLQTELGQVNARIRQLNSGARGAESSLSSLAGKFNKYAALASSFIATITGITLGLRKLVQMSYELADVQSDVMKTTNLTKQEVQELSAAFDQMNTRTSRIELLKMAEVAGRLGFEGKENIMGFVNAANQIEVALGKELGEDAIKQIGKMVSIFNLEEEFGIEQGMLKIASAINEIGMASTASEGFLVEFTKRMSGISGIANVTAADNIALAGTLDSLGQTAETSSTALNKIFVQMGRDAASFAEVAGVTEDVFREKLQKSALDALMLVLDGVNETADGMESLASILGDINMDGGRVVGVLGTLAKNTEEVRRQQLIANKAFEDGVSVTNEYNIKNENLAANLDRIGRKISQIFLSGKLMKSIEFIAGRIAKQLAPAVESYEKKTRSLNTEIQNEIEVLKNANLTQEQRSRLVSEINDKYGDYLPNLIREKDTVEDLAVMQGKLNDLFMEKIMLNAYQEEITKLVEDTMRAQEALYHIELQRTRLMQEKPEASPYGGGMVQEQMAQNLSAMKAFNSGIVQSEADARHQIEAKYSAMAANMGKVWSDLKAGMVKATRKTSNDIEFELQKSSEEVTNQHQGLLEELDKLDRQREISLLWAQQQEIERAADKYVKLLEMAQSGSDEERRILEGMAEEIATIQAKHEQQRLTEAEDFRNKFLRDAREHEKQMLLDQLQEYFDEALISEREYLEIREKIHEEFNEADEENSHHNLRRRRAHLRIGLEDQHKMLSEELEEIEILYEEDLITFEEMEKMKSLIQKQQMDIRVRQAKIMIGAMSDMVTSLQDMEMSRIESVTRMQDESEEDYTRRKEEEEEARKNIMKKYADISFAVKVAEIVSTTAAGMMRQYVDLPFAAALITKGMIGVTGATQLAIANRERQTVKGLERGSMPVRDQLGRNFNAGMGDGSTGMVNSPTLLVGEKPEFIIDPSTTKHLQFNYPEIIAGIYRARQEVRGFESGSMPDAGGGFDSSELRDSLNRNNMVMEQLVAVLQSGILAVLDDNEARKIRGRLEQIDNINRQRKA